jgi:mono/diheme cytochrome c family protein
MATAVTRIEKMRRTSVQKLNRKPIRIAAMSVLAAASLAATGCRQDMHNQPKFVPQRGTDFYADGRSARPQVENTVGRSQLRQDTYFYTGFQNGKEGEGLPFPVTMAVLERGQERYNIYCAPCHSRVGNGAGMIVQRGYAKAGNFHDARIAAAPLGHYFAVMTNGYGAMPEYAAQLTPEERWAVAAYIRALQLSQNATRADVPAGEQVKPISAVAESVGLPADFASDWGLPPTAVTGTPSGQPFSIPPQAMPENSPGASKPSSGNTMATGK